MFVLMSMVLVSGGYWGRTTAVTAAVLRSVGMPMG